MIALCDANSFYASAEAVFRPEWRDKPIVVLSNQDGCIVALNRRAKLLGAKKFTPFFRQRDFLERNGVICCSSNYELYADLSAKMMSVISSFAFNSYCYSIDEIFLELRNMRHVPCLISYGHQIRKSVWRDCRLPISVGIGETLTLAKAANHTAKQYRELNGVCLIDSESVRKDVLQRMATADVWGVGSRLSTHLDHMNIKTAWQLSQMNPALASKRFNVELERTVRELNGESCKHWENDLLVKKQIFSTRTTGQHITTRWELQEALCKHASTIAYKLRQQGSRCAKLYAFAHSSPYDANPIGRQFHQRLELPTNDTRLLCKIATTASHNLYLPGAKYRKVGVGAVEVTSDKNLQLDLLSEDHSNPKLMKVLDGINQRYGRGTLVIAGQGIEQKWEMRRERLTPQYTTNWRHLPKVRC